MPIKGDFTLLLAAQSAWTLGPGMSNYLRLKQKLIQLGSKRAVEPSTPDTSPDSKRVKVTPAAESSSPSPVKVTDMPKADIKPAETLPAPPASASSDASTVSNLTASTSSNVSANANGPPNGGRPNVPFQVAIASVIHKVKSVEQEIHTALASLNAAKAAGRLEEAQKLEEEIKSKWEVRRKVKLMLEQLGKAGRARAEQMLSSQPETKVETVQASQNQSSNQPLAAPPTSADNLPTTSHSTTQQPPLPLSQGNAQSKPPMDRQALAQLMQNRFSQPLPEQKPLLPTGNRPGANIPPSVAAQMEKLIQQQTGRTGMLPNAQQMNAAQNANNPTAQQPQTLLGKAERQRWTGSLTWTGFDHTVQRKVEVSAQVIVQSQQGKDM